MFMKGIKKTIKPQFTKSFLTNNFEDVNGNYPITL